MLNDGRFVGYERLFGSRRSHITQSDEALSRDCDHFDCASNIIRPNFFGEFGQKIHRKIKLYKSRELFRLAKLLSLTYASTTASSSL